MGVHRYRMSPHARARKILKFPLSREALSCGLRLSEVKIRCLRI